MTCGVSQAQTPVRVAQAIAPCAVSFFSTEQGQQPFVTENPFVISRRIECSPAVESSAGGSYASLTTGKIQKYGLRCRRFAGLGLVKRGIFPRRPAIFTATGSPRHHIHLPLHLLPVKSVQHKGLSPLRDYTAAPAVSPSALLISSESAALSLISLGSQYVGTVFLMAPTTFS